ncbi:MAG: hypothetical protein ACJ8DZ_08215 [Allosphingosinicella sp.]
MAKAILFLAGAGALALGAAAWAQSGGGGTATYWMSADTLSGMGGMMGGGGRPSMGSVMGAMMGRGGGISGGQARQLHLQLGGSARPAGEPQAEHLPPAGLGVGPSLPLVSPRQAPAEPSSTGFPTNMERPRGRILIYWGCGEHARPGQPVVFDFAAISAGHVPPAFANSAYRPELPPSPARFPSYGEWPNERGRTNVPATGSLVGEHVVHGNYSPEIRFTLGAGQDFLAPVTLVSQAPSPTGAVPVVWRPVPGARAWFATAMGAAGNGDTVMWTSSETQAAPMMDYMPDGEIARLVQSRVLMPAAADRCTVPAEVAHAGQGSMFTLTALGGEANFSHPVRPARAPAGWRPDWLVKLRIKSTYMGLLGMDMNAMMRGESGDRSEQGEGDQPRKKKKRGLLDGLGGMIPH